MHTIFSSRTRLPVRVAALGVSAILAVTLGVGLVAPVTAMAAAKAPCDVKCVIDFGNLRIDRRLDALTKLNDRIATQADKGRITADQKAALQGDVANNQSGLTALRAKLDAETDATAARADVKTIYTQFRIYAVVLPRDYHQIALDIMVNLQAKLAGLEPKLQDAINNAPADKKDQLNTLYSDYTAKVASASTHISNAESQVPNLTPQNYDNSRNNYQIAWDTFRSEELAARANLRQAGSDLHQMTQLLKGTSTSTPSASS